MYLHKLRHIKTNISQHFSWFYTQVRHVQRHILQLCSLAVLHFLAASIQVPATKKTNKTPECSTFSDFHKNKKKIAKTNYMWEFCSESKMFLIYYRASKLNSKTSETLVTAAQTLSISQDSDQDNEIYLHFQHRAPVPCRDAPSHRLWIPLWPNQIHPNIIKSVNFRIHFISNVKPGVI